MGYPRVRSLRVILCTSSEFILPQSGRENQRKGDHATCSTRSVFPHPPLLAPGGAHGSRRAQSPGGPYRAARERREPD
ncbi:hypothetical protein K466DRAFT_312335 [Polyporus arcularius HHB13444]|uniref:Uncharacterized protein n=1 Tax=Polyporus arcularius HHB13444 TaxID=1314778 RepID=A0A5C3NY06_9APHY|nr:hypothetical protein K466DRAFT_312335 [Polyporus arcularius HHB13444]